MGAPKEGVRLAGGRTMIERVLGGVAPLGLPVYLSVPPEPGAYLRGLGLPLVQDERAFEGPLAAVARGLEESGAASLLVVCCDQPLLRAETLELLFAEEDAELPVFFRRGDGTSLAPFPGLFPAGSLPRIREALAGGERSPRYWAAGAGCRWVTLDGAAADSLASFNTVEQLGSADLLEETP